MWRPFLTFLDACERIVSAPSFSCSILPDENVFLEHDFTILSPQLLPRKFKALLSLWRLSFCLWRLFFFCVKACETIVSVPFPVRFSPPKFLHLSLRCRWGSVWFLGSPHLSGCSSSHVCSAHSRKFVFWKSGAPAEPEAQVQNLRRRKEKKSRHRQNERGRAKVGNMSC